MPPFDNVDLHCHTTASDGRLRPEELVQLAVSRDIDLLAITDHDNAAGFREARAFMATTPDQYQGLTLISGVEFSTLWRGLNIHVIGLGVDVDCDIFLAAEAQQANAREGRAKTIAERLCKKGLPDVYAAAIAYASSPSAVGRPHFAQALIDCGAVKDFDEAFNKWLGAGKIGDVKVMWPTIEQAIDWIRCAGGVSVLAHPHKYKMTRTKLCDLLSHFALSGGAAMEIAFCQQRADEQRDLARLARQFGLSASRGSDYHGDHMPWNSLGRANEIVTGVTPVWEKYSLGR
ncbi:MAG TPA: PHP domain-containing protein [Pseudomonadales bacterium]|nr:PHP domain-containing protein [Pseudomonadales bacterium]